jgi:hypothetical protein
MAADRRTDIMLVLVRFLACGFYILPLVRLVSFKLSGMALPISALNGFFALALLCSSLLYSRALRIGNSVLLAVLVFTAQMFLFAGTVVYRKGSFESSDLATAWIYFVSPVLFVFAGGLFSNGIAERDLSAIRQRTEYWLNVAGWALLLGAFINGLDVVILGDSYSTVYEKFATTSPATFGDWTLPRLSGAYFSGLDFAMAVIVLMALRHYSNLPPSRWMSLTLYFLACLTFTRNAYVILVAWLFLRKAAPGRVAKLSSVIYLLGPILSVAVVAIMLAQTAAGQLEVSAESSSMLTRMASWLAIYQQFAETPSAGFVGLGLTQNALIPGESDVYAIDNFYLELLCYSGLVAYICYGLLFKGIRYKALNTQGGVGATALMLLLFVPVMGVFNNMVGSMLCSALFFVCGLLALTSRSES